MLAMARRSGGLGCSSRLARGACGKQMGVQGVGWGGVGWKELSTVPPYVYRGILRDTTTTSVKRPQLRGSHG